MKEKLSGSLGTFGVILWYVVSILFTIAPLLILRFPGWLDFLLILAILSLPLIGTLIQTVLYVWAFFVAIRGPFDIFVILFFVFFAFFLFTTLVPLVKSLLSQK